MRQSQAYIPTLKEVSSDVQMPSYKLMLRAGLVRNLAAGVFSWLPLGWTILKKVMDILREEQSKIGAQEFMLPGLNPIEIWEATNRVEAMGDVMFHIKNREGLVLAPTHEEVITYHAKQHVNSYRDMPQMWYQIQSKFRNEPRPRSGVMRGRQFYMKDAYSLDVSFDALDKSYQNQYDAYCSTFDRCGIKYFVVGASSGAMGGRQSQEFMVENEFGEDVCAITDSGYSANVEVATSKVDPVGRISENPELELFDTPNSKTINDLVNDFGFDVNRCAKSYVIIVDGEAVLVLMRGNDEFNESKAQAIFGTSDIRPAHDEELPEITGAHGGSIGPINLKTKIKVYADNILKGANGLVSGANQDGKHYKNIDFERDLNIDAFHDFRTVLEGELDPENGDPIRVVKAIELGHIFKLGTKYSEGLQALFVDEDGKEKPIVMGSYGIGVERILACYIEQNHDDRGIIWSRELTPYHIHLIGINNHKSESVSTKCEELYSKFQEMGYDVLFDDRKERPGFKFNDADLIGLPVQVIVGEKSLNEGNLEVKIRRNGERLNVPVDEIINKIDGFLDA